MPKNPGSTNIFSVKFNYPKVISYNYCPEMPYLPEFL